MERELIQQCLAARDGTISPADLAVLEERLRQDPEARRCYLRITQLESLLELCPPADSVSVEEGKVVSMRRKAVISWSAIAAVIAVLATVLVQPFFDKPDAKVAVAADSARLVATLIFAEDCTWGEDRAADMEEGQRLPAGTMHLLGGTAIVRFDGGAELALTGDTVVRLDSPGEGTLLRGEVVVRAEDGAEGFVLHTPDSNLVDLGTEFGVKVDRGGTTELHVLEGEVAVRTPDQVKGTGEIVQAGRAVRIERSAVREGEFSSPGFSTVVRRAKPRERPDLMRVYEGFFLEPGMYEPSELDGGKGWAGPWRMRGEDERGLSKGDASSTMHVVMRPLNQYWRVKGGHRTALEMPAPSTIRVRPLAGALDLDQRRITYLSFMVTEPQRELIHPHRTGGLREAMRLTFRSSADYFGESLTFGWDWDGLPRIGAGLGRNFKGAHPVPVGQTLFCVGKVISRPDREDEVSFRIYGEEEELPYAEPRAWDVTTRDLEHHGRLDLLLITSESGQSRYFDELRIGPTWRSVVPIREPAPTED